MPAPSKQPDLAAAAYLARLRDYRRRRDPATPLGAAVTQEVEALRRLQRRLGDAGRAWGVCSPEPFSDKAVPVGFHGGVLTVACSDASVRHRVDRWLRSGGLAELQRASRAPLRRVRVTIGAS